MENLLEFLSETPIVEGIFCGSKVAISMKIMSLNCQQAHHPDFMDFFSSILREGEYDVLLLQEAKPDMVSWINDHQDISYRVTRNTASDREGLTCIVSKTELSLMGEPHFIHFPHKKIDNFVFPDHHTFGMLCLKMQVQSEEIICASMHLPSGFNQWERRSYLKTSLTTILEKYNHSKIIIGGDFNFGFPWELENAMNRVAPDFVCVSEGLSPTLNSYFTEEDMTWTSQISKILRYFGVSIQLKTDHFFIHETLFSGYTHRVSQLPQRVSDHSPIVLEIEGI